MDYDTSEWIEVEVKITPSGKAPKHYGEGVYRFSASATLSVILPKRGWKLIKKTKSYAYLKPPEVSMQPPFSIFIKIPNKEQALDIAEESYEKGENWWGQLGEWLALYVHKHSTYLEELVPSEGELKRRRLPSSTPPKSSLIIGESGVWQMEVSKTDGAFEFSEHGEINRQNDPIQPIQEEQTMVEGRSLTLQLNKYERSKNARLACISYHGTSCKVCDFNFEHVYGEIGKGFIHIHYVIPISSRGGEYVLDPVTDLIPLCPNCHSMIHRKEPPFTVAELREMLMVRSNWQ